MNDAALLDSLHAALRNPDLAWYTEFHAGESIVAGYLDSLTHRAFAISAKRCYRTTGIRSRNILSNYCAGTDAGRSRVGKLTTAATAR